MRNTRISSSACFRFFGVGLLRSASILCTIPSRYSCACCFASAAVCSASDTMPSACNFAVCALSFASEIIFSALLCAASKIFCALYSATDLCFAWLPGLPRSKSHFFPTFSQKSDCSSRRVLGVNSSFAHNLRSTMGTRFRCICGVVSSMWTTAEMIFSSPYFSAKYSVASSKNRRCCDGISRLKNSPSDEMTNAPMSTASLRTFRFNGSVAILSLI